jgi:hypothetical protein
MHRTLRSSIVTVLLIGAGAACSRTDTPAVAQSASTASASAASTPAAVGPDAPLNLCTVMPVDVVSRVLQSHVGKSVSVATPHVGGMCNYKDVDKGVPAVQVLVDFTRHEKASDAATAYRNVRAQTASMGPAPADIPGIGDEAFGSGGTVEDYGVKTHSGPYMGQVNVHADGASAEAARAAAIELAQLTLTRLPKPGQ